MSSDIAAPLPRPWQPDLRRLEVAALGLCATLLTADAMVALVRGITVDLASFAPHAAIAFGLLGGAQYYRATARSERIALALNACAILLLFTNAGAVFNYLMIPAGKAPWDAVWVSIDRSLGFDWWQFAGALSEWPRLSRVLGVFYLAALPQMILTLLVLGLGGWAVQLHRFLACGMMASLVSIATWLVIPSSGPATLRALDAQTAQDLGLVLGWAYDVGPRSLLAHGVTHIDAAQLIGLIAFPSMHTVMLCMPVFYARRTPAFWPFAVLAVPMVPGIIVHGDHNVVDLIGGVAVFAVMALLSRRLVPGDPAARVADRTAP